MTAEVVNIEKRGKRYPWKEKQALEPYCAHGASGHLWNSTRSHARFLRFHDMRTCFADRFLTLDGFAFTVNGWGIGRKRSKDFVLQLQWQRMETVSIWLNTQQLRSRDFESTCDILLPFHWWSTSQFPVNFLHHCLLHQVFRKGWQLR